MAFIFMAMGGGISVALAAYMISILIFVFWTVVRILKMKEPGATV